MVPADQEVLSESVNNGCEGEKVWLETDVCDPGLGGGKREVVGLVLYPPSYRSSIGA